jgi:hypothetical protein
VGQSPSLRSGEEKNPLPLPGIETRFLGCPARYLMNTERAISAPVFFMLSHIYATVSHRTATSGCYVDQHFDVHCAVSMCK